LKLPFVVPDRAIRANFDAVSKEITASIALPPSGAAGGVLSGSYPNPGFAVDMATQAELDAAIAGLIASGDAAGGDLSGTYPNPVVEQSSAAGGFTQLQAGDPATKAIHLLRTDVGATGQPSVGAWIRNDGSNMVISTTQGDIFYGSATTNTNLRHFFGSGAANVAQVGISNGEDPGGRVMFSSSSGGVLSNMDVSIRRSGTGEMAVRTLNPITLGEAGDYGTWRSKAYYSEGTAGAGFYEGTEQSSDPSAPSADRGRLYFKDDGSGNTRLYLRSTTENKMILLEGDVAAGSGHVIQDEGTPLTAQPNLNFAGAGVTVTNDGANSATLVTIPGAAALDADLVAIAALTGTGHAVRTAADTWALRTITGTGSQITVTNGDGTAGNPTISLPVTVQLGVDDTTGGRLDLFGNGAGNAEGGEIRWHLAADHDTSFDYFFLDAYEDDFRLLRSTGTNLMVVKGDTFAVTFPNATSAGSGLILGGDVVLFRNGADVLGIEDRVHIQRTAGSDIALSARRAADTHNRIYIEADGRIFFGDGTTTSNDTLALYRVAAAQVGTTSEFKIIRPTEGGTDYALTTLDATDATPRFGLLANGKMEWGDGAAARDTNLYRDGADILRTDDALEVGGQLRVDNLVQAVRTSAAPDTAAGLQVGETSDTQLRYWVALSGKMEWGAGGATARDTNLYRAAADTLRTDDTLQSNRASTGLVAFGSLVASVARYRQYADGKMGWADTAGTEDTNLYRSAANILKTDDKLEVDSLRVGASTTAGWVLTSDASGNATWAAPSGGGGGYATIAEEGVALTARSTLNFIGSGITAADNAGSTRTDVTLATALNNIVSNSAQTFGGVKTFSSSITALNDLNFEGSSSIIRFNLNNSGQYVTADSAAFISHDLSIDRLRLGVADVGVAGAVATPAVGLQLAASGASPLLGFFGTAPVARSTGWSATNVTSDTAFDANSTTVAELADVLGTLIDTLKTYGLLAA
jgi:hypothetical protein